MGQKGPAPRNGIERGGKVGRGREDTKVVYVCKTLLKPSDYNPPADPYIVLSFVLGLFFRHGFSSVCRKAKRNGRGVGHSPDGLVLLLGLVILFPRPKNAQEPERLWGGELCRCVSRRRPYCLVRPFSLSLSTSRIVKSHLTLCFIQCIERQCSIVADGSSI